MDSKKLLQIAAILVAGVWIATMGTVIVFKTVKGDEATTTTPIQTQNSTTANTPHDSPDPEVTVSIGGNSVVTTVKGETPQWKVDEQSSIAASVEQSKKDASNKAEQNKTTTKKASIVPSGKVNVVDAYIKGINNLKKTQKFTLDTTSVLNIVVDEVTGGSMVQSAVENFIADSQQEPQHYSFVNGVDSSTGTTVKEIIPPENKSASLNVNAVLSATAVENTDGGYTLTIKLADETQTSSASAKNHESVMPVIDIQDFMVSGASVEDYEILYTEATITATFDKNNRIVYLEQYLCVPAASGNGRMTLIPVTLAMHGDYTGTYEIRY